VRTIHVSLDVFQAIWTARKDNEQNEDAILRRLLKLTSTPKQAEPERDLITQVGFHDPRYGVEIPPGFEIYRNYQGTKYTARAIQGFWHLNGVGYPTLNELNKTIAGGAENAWKAWYFLDERGRKHPLSEKRDQSKIVRRS
jgi:hypothetical protein